MSSFRQFFVKNASTIIAAVASLVGVVLGGYLFSLSSSDQTIRSWKREAYGTLISEVMYATPDMLLPPKILRVAECVKGPGLLWGFTRNRPPLSTGFSEEGTALVHGRIARAFGTAILLADRPLQRKLIDFMDTVNFEILVRQRLLEFGIREGRPLAGREIPPIPPEMGKEEVCKRVVDANMKTNQSRIEVLALMRKEMGLP